MINTEELIVILSPSEWGQSAVSNMHYALLFNRQKNTKVLYFESIATRNPKFSDLPRIIKRLSNFFFKKKVNKSILDKEDIHIKSPIVIPFHNINFISLINTQLLFLQLIKSINFYNFKNISIICYSPNWAEVIAKLRNIKKTIFHCVDNLETYSNHKKYISKIQFLSKISDYIVVPNKTLSNYFLNYQNKLKIIPHGCSHKALKNNLFKKEIVISGSFTNWIDYDLLEDLVKNFGEFTFHLVGKVYDKNNKLLNLISNNDNVKYHGFLEYKNLANIYKNCSIGLVLYNPEIKHIQYSTPTKFADYIFADLIILSTNFPNAHEYGSLVKVCNSSSEFIQNIKNFNYIYNESIRISEREVFLKKATWESRFKDLKKLLL